MRARADRHQHLARRRWSTSTRRSPALDGGRSAALALDVTEPEPLPEGHPLRDHPRAIVTPHMAFYSVEAERGAAAPGRRARSSARFAASRRDVPGQPEAHRVTRCRCRASYPGPRRQGRRRHRRLEGHRRRDLPRCWPRTAPASRSSARGQDGDRRARRASCRELGGEAIGVAADGTDARRAGRSSAPRSRSELGPVELLAPFAGGFASFTPVAEITDEEWRRRCIDWQPHLDLPRGPDVPPADDRARRAARS